MTGSLISSETIVSALLLSAAASLAAAAAIPSTRRLSNLCKRLTPMQVVVLLTAVGIATASAQKSVTNGVDIVEGTNGVGGVTLNAPQPMFSGGAMSCGFGAMGASCPTIAAYDVTRGYRLDSVTTNDAISYEMPDDATEVGTWRLTGAYDDVVMADLGEFRFPLGTNLCSSLWAQTWGTARPRLRNVSNELVAVGAPMSAIPDVSRFWTAQTANDSFLLTWQDFALGRIPAATNTSCLLPLTSYLVSAQLELCRNGDFIARSNNVELIYRRVIEPNPISPINPVDPDDPTMPLHPYGPVQDLSVIGETNAYCWVDLVVRQADARVRFEGDGASNLADPSFAAKAGETNHVVILIGKTYKVTCDMPLEIVGKSDGSIDDWREDERTLWLNWPVHVWSQGDHEDGPLILLGAGNGANGRKGFTMFVSPSGLGGGFTWTNCCCSVSGTGWYFTYNCQEDCTCGGCAATGYLSYEGYRLPASGGSCGCSYEEEPDDPHGPDPDDPPPPAGMSICFSKTAVIFEDEYHPTSTSTVLSRSTETELCCSVYGGEHGGTVLITATGIDNRLDCVGGSQTFPVYRQLEPQETFAFTNSYKAIAQSGSANDIVVMGTFVENDTGETFEDEDKATAIRVEFGPDKRAPANDSQGRHKFGVYEIVNCHQYPSLPQLSWNLTAGTMFENNTKYRCPLDIAIGNPIKVSCGGAEFTPIISVVTPNQVVARNVGYDDFGAPLGEAGSIALILELFIGPFDVDFREIAVEEVPDSGGTGSGYFGRMDLASWTSHTIANGAGRWFNVAEGNRMGGEEDVCDQAGVTEPLSRMNASGLFVDDPNCGWLHGTIDMPNPFGWNAKDTTSGQPIGRFAENTRDFIELEDYGKCSVQKLQNEVYRLTNGCVYLNGVMQ